MPLTKAELSASSIADLPSRAELDAIYGGKGATVLITGTRLTAAQEVGMRVHLLAAYDDAINPYDVYYVYAIA